MVWVQRISKNIKEVCVGIGKMDSECKMKWSDDDEADLPCLRYANPIMLFSAVAVVFTTIFCIMFYVSMNSRGFINDQVILPPDVDAVDITNSSVTMVMGKLLILCTWRTRFSVVFSSLVVKSGLGFSPLMAVGARFYSSQQIWFGTPD